MEFRRVLFRSGACRGSEDAPAACRGTVILFGGEPSGTGSRGCPAVLDFRREGAGRTSTSAFPARTASLPRAAKSTAPGPRGLRVDTARSRIGHLPRSEGHTPARQSLMRISYAVFCL